MKVSCEYCGTELERTPYRLRQQKHQFCNKACFDAWQREQGNYCICEQCGKTFKRPPKHAARTEHQFCSHLCYGEWNKGQNNPAYQGGKVALTCQQCGKTFYRKRGEAARPNANFCSQSCRGKAYPANAPHHLSDYCAYCGTPIKLKLRKQVGKRNFCCRSHANQAHSEYISGENNPRYVDGMAAERYPYEFIKLAPLIRERDQNQCFLCHMTREEHGKELSVHHIDYDIYHNEPANLVTLCRWCHGKMHGSPEQRYQWRFFWSDQSSRFPHLNMSTTSE